MADRRSTFLCAFSSAELEMLRYMQRVRPMRGGVRDQIRRAVVEHAVTVPGFSLGGLRDHLDVALVRGAKGEERDRAKREIRELETALSRRSAFDIDGVVDSRVDFGSR